MQLLHDALQGIKGQLVNVWGWGWWLFPFPRCLLLQSGQAAAAVAAAKSASLPLLLPLAPTIHAAALFTGLVLQFDSRKHTDMSVLAS